MFYIILIVLLVLSYKKSKNLKAEVVELKAFIEEQDKVIEKFIKKD